MKDAPKKGGAAKTGRAKDAAKLERVIDAAITEFALHGYKKANTNRIVEKAGISKGLLFHYFGSKKELYLYLYDYAVRMVVEEVVERFDVTERDIFKRWKAGARIKFALMRKNPMLFEFILDAYLRASDEVKGSIDTSTLSWMAWSSERALASADLSLFRDGVDPRKALEIVYWCQEGYSKKWLNPENRLDYYEKRQEEMVEGLFEYLDLLKEVFYK
ncbi:MAG: TetR/AcrR family transcriptional regulator [Clostridiales Family XIII bacterium]|jgi:AcrR family transcriptional regulator|nr:TetR/AcrR family transcriptional regulator [Clostridiales Family XIII bacterium]